jgi:hypothetical protein
LKIDVQGKSCGTIPKKAGMNDRSDPNTNIPIRSPGKRKPVYFLKKIYGINTRRRKYRKGK